MKKTKYETGLHCSDCATHILSLEPSYSSDTPRLVLENGTKITKISDDWYMCDRCMEKSKTPKKTKCLMQIA